MHIHLIQTDIDWEQKELNFDSVRSHIERMPVSGGALVLLPEMFATGFSMAADLIAEDPSAGAPTARFLADIAGEKDCCVVGGAATRSHDGFYNEAIVAYPSGESLRYQKHQPFTLGGEGKVFAAGTSLKTFSWAGWRVGLSICYDLRFPEIYRALALGGAELLLNIANWPSKRISHWVTLLQARAIENQCYVAGVNRVGEDPNSNYVGRSVVVDPHGEIIADAGDREQAITAHIELERLRDWRAEFPALADARDEPLPVRHFQSRVPSP